MERILSNNAISMQNWLIFYIFIYSINMSKPNYAHFYVIIITNKRAYCITLKINIILPYMDPYLIEFNLRVSYITVDLL